MVSDICGLRKFTEGREAGKFQITTLYLFSSMLEPWILPRDIGSIPMRGTETIWMPAHIVKHLKHVYLYSPARPTK